MSDKPMTREQQIAELELKIAREKLNRARRQTHDRLDPIVLDELEVKYLRALQRVDEVVPKPVPTIAEVMFRPGDEKLNMFEREIVHAQRLAGEDPLPGDPRTPLERAVQDAQRFADPNEWPPEYFETLTTRYLSEAPESTEPAEKSESERLAQFLGIKR